MEKKNFEEEEKLFHHDNIIIFAFGGGYSWVDFVVNKKFIYFVPTYVCYDIHQEILVALNSRTVCLQIPIEISYIYLHTTFAKIALVNYNPHVYI